MYQGEKGMKSVCVCVMTDREVRTGPGPRSISVRNTRPGTGKSVH
jgi:hypothetical protein